MAKCRRYIIALAVIVCFDAGAVVAEAVNIIVTPPQPMNGDREVGCDVLVVGQNGSMTFPPYLQVSFNGRYAWQVTGDNMTIEQVTASYAARVNDNANINLNEGGNRWPVNPGPLLIVCGALCYGEECEECPTCYPSGPSESDLLITDINGDGLPNGPVTRIPATSAVQVQKAVDNAEDYSNASLVGPWHGVVFFVGDIQHDGTAAQNPFYLCMRAGEAYRNEGFHIFPILRRSDLPNDQHLRFQAAAGVFGDPGHVVELFGAGFSASPENWCSIFYRPSTADYNTLSQPQIITAWMPVCQTASWYAENGDVMRPYRIGAELMFDGTSSAAVKLAGMVGLSGAVTYDQQELLGEYLVEARMNAIPGQTTIADIAYNAAMSLISAHPEDTEAALYVTTLGSYVQIPDYTEVVAVDDEITVREPKIRILGATDGGTRIQYELTAGGDVGIEIYDVRGARVREMKIGERQAGVYYSLWDGSDSRGRNVPSGVYLVVAKLGFRGRYFRGESKIVHIK